MTGSASSLQDLMASEADQPIPPVVQACTSFLRLHFGATTAGILFYGAGLRQPITSQTLLDFYVIVDRPCTALNSIISGLAAMVLPPNVYLVEVPLPAGVVRTKVAVISRAAFNAGATAFSSHLWGRFAQPTAIAYSRDSYARQGLLLTLTASAATFIARTLPLMPLHFTATDLWVRGLQECYAAELRPELSGRAEALVGGNAARYSAVTAAVLGPPGADGFYIGSSPEERLRAERAWQWRRRWGKTTNLLRLMKAAFTFAGGLDYAVAKIARHTGVSVAISDRDRRHPLLAGIRVFLEARRRGGVR